MPGQQGLDEKSNGVFSGKVVRKDLVRKVKVGANVPVYVLEYLLGKYCATDDAAAVEAGLRTVNRTLADNFVRSDEGVRAQSRVREEGSHSFIDKVKVRLLVSEDRYWAELVNFGYRYVHIPEEYVRRYDRLLAGGIWARVDLEYRPEESVGGKIQPFFITQLQPIQLAAFDLDDFMRGRGEFSTEEWLDLLVRSVGLEPALLTRRQKLLVLARLIPMVEHNFNLIELGPRGTGKSFVYREVSPYSILVSGGKTTTANLFYNMATGKMGLVGLWDVVAFDEVAGIRFEDRTAVQILKDFMEAGSFSRGKEELVADASLSFLGNINTPVEVLVRSAHLFQPLPSDMGSDMAFLDRLHFYLPGWELPKLSTELFTNGYGFVSDYLAEALRALRKQNFTELIDHYFSLGRSLNARDVKAVRKTVSGYIKLMHPDGVLFTPEELAEYLELALEGRRRVKEQLKKLGAFEYYQTSFSYLDAHTREERFVGVPEEGGNNLISPDPLPPGSAYALVLREGDKLSISRIEVGKMPGTGKLRISGGLGRSMRESIQTAFDFLKSHRREMALGEDMDSYDFHAQVVDLMSAKEGSMGGVAFFLALYSLMRGTPIQAGMLALGEMTVQGRILPVKSLTEALQLAMDNGARKVLIPLENKRQFLEVPGEIVEKVDPVFYSDPLTAALKSVDVR